MEDEIRHKIYRGEIPIPTHVEKLAYGVALSLVNSGISVSRSMIERDILIAIEAGENPQQAAFVVEKHFRDGLYGNEWPNANPNSPMARRYAQSLRDGTDRRI